MSGGQMQRVAIARAIVNNPDIVLADEPTGALDSHTSVQVMEILKEISKTRLVVMVTHNSEIANQYSSRVIRLLDGEVQSDSNPIDRKASAGKEQNPVIDGKKAKLKRTSMSLATATSLSFKNLLTKKGRTIITSFAGSVGIIGVALVLALSNGLSTYMSSMQSETLSGFPVTISTSEQSVDFSGPRMMGQDNDAAGFEKFTDKDVIYRYDPGENVKTHTNILTDDYLDYVAGIETELPDTVNTISYTRGVGINLLAKGNDTVVKYETSVSPSSVEGADRMEQVMQNMGMSSSYWQEIPDNDDFILSLYDLIGEGSRLPKDKSEVVLVVDEYSRLDEAFFEKLGIDASEKEFRLTDFIGKTIFKVVPNNDFYTKTGDIFVAANPSEYSDLFESDAGVSLTVTGVLRIKKDASSGYLSQGIAYTTALTDYVVSNEQKSEIAGAQKQSDKNVLTGMAFNNDDAKKQTLLYLGADTTPTGINIYPKDFNSKEQIKEYLKAYNEGKAEADQIVYSDMAETITSMTGVLLDTISYVLIGFAAISLLVSTIMIGIITYVSVIERTKEIGILRSVGARKKDISRLFNAETLIVGFTAGMIGIGLSYLLTMPINAIISNLVSIEGIASLNPLHAVMLILGSMALTLIAGLFPARIAAKKDPVVALRTE